MMTSAAKNHSYTNSHVAFFYATLAERMKMLTEYFSEGLMRNELCIFATPGTVDQAIDDFRAAGLDVRPAIDDQSLLIFEMYETYLPHGKFVADFMLANVANFIEDSKKRGRSGLRTAGEMRWINVYPHFLPAATHYEDDVNKLCADNHDFIGLCLYPIVPDSLEILKSALATHSAFLYDGKLRINPFTIAPGKDKIIDASDVTSFTALLADV